MLRGDVLLISKNIFMRQGLVQALAKNTLSVVGEESSPEAALSMLDAGLQHVDLIVLDADSRGGTDCMKALADQFPQVSIVVIAASPDRAAFAWAAEIQAKALLPQEVSAEALNLALQLVILGENLFLATTQSADAAEHAPWSSRQSEASSHLSPRESQILSFIKRGASNKAIARELDVAEATVKVHVKSVMRKIDVGNRTQAAIWAVHNLDENDIRAA